jgi:Cu/Ag efflux protein CusF
MPVRSARVAVLLGFLALLVQQSPPAAAHEATIRGLVLATMPRSAEVVLRHDALLGPPASISTFRVVPASALRGLHAGSTIEATADRRDALDPRGIRVIGSGALTGAATSSVPQLLRNVHHVVVGEYAPARRSFSISAGNDFRCATCAEDRSSWRSSTRAAGMRANVR